ncbi:MAG: NAD(+) synthase [Sphingomonadaceae bacterium]
MSGEGGGPIARALAIDAAAEAERIAGWIREQLRSNLRRRGLVVAVSGGVDSAVCAGLAARAVGASRVFALLLPETDSDPESTIRGREVVERFGIAHEIVPITPALEGVGCYAKRDAAIAALIPGYGPGWRSKIATTGADEGGFARFRIIVEDPEGRRQEALLDSGSYRAIVAATSFKQRIRKMLEYYHADRLHHAVVGTPNLLEYELGFFVKNGDGAADLKPIAHLYKTEVYALARALGVPESVTSAAPSTDTYSLPQGQDEFYFVLDHRRMDLALAGLALAMPDDVIMAETGLDADGLAWLRQDIDRKREAAAILHQPPLVMERA